MRNGRKHLYSRETKRSFERRYERKGYNKSRADRIWGATVGRIKRLRGKK